MTLEQRPNVPGVDSGKGVSDLPDGGGGSETSGARAGAPTRLIAIDPGSHRLGYALFDGPRLHYAGALDVKGKSLRDAITLLAERMLLGTTHAAIEIPGAWLGARKADRNLAGLAVLYQMIGAIRFFIEGSAVPLLILEDTEVKYALTGRKNAGKGEVHGLLSAVFGIELPRLREETCHQCRDKLLPDAHSPDAADAIAIGLCATKMLEAPAIVPETGQPRPVYKQRVLG